MNQHIHKVIFNKTTGRMDVVSEMVSAQGGATLASANESPNPAWHHSVTQFLIKPVVFALMLSLGTAHILPVQAQVIADPNAPSTQQPTVLPTASGATQINIQTPSAAGVSMNQYRQFDTQTNGTVLNNSRTNTNTQTAGWIQANPWLATGSARVIVNQVNSSNPSQLTGNIEVAGQRADLIIANPSGININGAAIINANRATFTTGVPQLTNGNLTGYQVNQGQINIDGAGLNATGSDYTDLLARAVKVNAGIWANNLAITTGANSINTDNSQFAANTATGAAPSLAIDTSALGGMYAGKITLIGTENGVGVNNAGQIAASAGNVTIDANGLLGNSGTINSNGAENATQIKSTQLANTGSISSQGNTQIQTAALTNSGTIAAGREAKLTATDLNNSTGTINGQRIDITVTSLNNTQGKIQQTGTQALALNAGSISNTNNGLIGYEPLDTGSGTGTGTGSTGTTTNPTTPSTAAGGGSSTVVQPTPVVLADGQISVQNHLDNDAGRITANGGIDLTASNGLENHATLNLNKLNVTGDVLDNSSGQINSTQTDVTVNTINNVAGQIQTVGNSHIQANSLDNRTGLIRSEQGNTLVVNSIDNSNTQGADQGIEGTTVAIQGSQLNNTSGALRAKTDLTTQITSNINNAQGLISSNGTLKLTDKQANSLAITNTAGQIISEGNQSIQAKSLTGDGTVTSNTDLNIQLADSFNNAGTTSAVGNLTFTTAGDLTNVTALKAGNSVSIGAQNIDNKVGAEISSTKTQLTANDSLTNRGLIDGGDTFLQANTVNNVGTGRIYGDHIAMGAGTLNNVDETLNGVNTAATIAARHQLDIGAQIINNREHSTLFADGALNIGGGLDANHVATGQANTVNNASATIESTGDMKLSAGQINNTNLHFASEIQVVKQERVSEVQGFIAGEASPTPLDPSAVYVVDPDKMATLPSLGNDVSPDYLLNAEYGVLIHNDQSNHLVTPEGLYGNWNLKDFIRTTSESVVTSSDPAKIVAGGNLTLSSNQLLNDNSQVIVGGTLLGDAGAVLNQETLGQRIIQDVGTTNDFWRNHNKGRDSTGGSSAAYNVTHPTQSINISTASVQLNTASSPSTDAGTRNTGNLTVNTEGVNQIRTAVVNTHMPNSSLFTVNPNNAGYYIQTDPRFANYRNWLSSDWMLNALNLDPANMHKRLGDGYYEQKLIKEQIAQLTGRRYLGDYNNDDTQYQALMNAGVTFAGQYGLRPGVALTAEQMARLTSDIVWLVEQEVSLPDGSTVTALVPKVYVAVKPGDIDGSGALISANSIRLNLTGDLNNAGTVSGRQVTQITAQNINNQGRINANQLDLQAANDLNNIGGTLDANTSASIRAGHDINVTTTTNSASSQFGSQTSINRVAGIYVGDGADAPMGNTPVNTLVIQAGNNVNLTAAQIDNAGMGNTVIKATQGDVNLSTVKLANTDTFYRDARNGHSVRETVDIGSSINGVGNVTLSAGHDINAKAADVNSNMGTLTAVAGHDINLTTGEATRDTVADSYEKTHRTGSTKKTTIHTDSSSNNAIATNFTGAQVVLDAGHDANIIGSNVVSDNLTSIRADNDVNIKAATDTYSSDYSKEVKRSGLSGGFSAGVLSVGYSKSKTNTTNDNQITTQAASTVASLYGDTQVVAGNQLHVTASDIAAGDDITLVGKDIQLTAAQETNRQDSTYKSSSSGFSIGITLDPAAAFKSAYKSTYDNTPATGTVGKVTRAAEAVAAGMKAAMTPIVVTAGSHHSSSESHIATSDARVSTVQAGGDLKMIATDGSITSQGSQISAEGDALLLAKDNINLDVAHNYETQTSDSRASGWGFDNRMIGLPIGVYKSKANGDGTTDTTVGTNLSVGGSATLATTTGDINIIGSNLVSVGDMNLNAANDLNIISAQNTAENENHSRSKAIGNVVISDTERFMGYHSEKANNDNQTVTQVSSNVGSLTGNVNATAGNQYTQIASNVVAGNDINVTAKDIEMLTAQNTGDAHSDQSALKIGVFARVSSPIIDLVNNIDAAHNSDGRLQAMQGMAAAGNAYQAASAVTDMLTSTPTSKGYGSGNILKAEVGIGVSSSRSNDNSTYSTSVGNTLTAGNNIHLTSTDGNIHAQQTDMMAGDTIALNSAKDILLDAGQSTEHTDGQHSNYGAEIGVGVTVGAQTGVYAYAQASAGKGSYNTDTVTNSNTHLTADKIQINSQGDTTLKGAIATANSISTDVGGKLTIESLQNTGKQTSSESGMNARVQVSFGNAWEVSGGVNASKGNGDYAQVAEQSGLFAGEGGYHVKAQDVSLIGGAITSTNAANSDLTANTFAYSDLQNHMNYSVSSSGVNFSSNNTAASNIISNMGNIANMVSSTPTTQTSTTRATLTEGNITIGGQTTTAQATGINIDATQATGVVENLPDVQALLEQQQAQNAAVSTILSSTVQFLGDQKEYRGNQLKQAEDALDEAINSGDANQIAQAQSTYQQANESYNHWAEGGTYNVAVNALAQIVTGWGSDKSPQAIAAVIASPLVANQIGDKIGQDNVAGKFVAHALLAGMTAALSGADNREALSVGLSTGLIESVVAPKLAQELYGTSDSSKLTAEQRQNILALSGVAGSLIAGLAGDSTTAAIYGGSTAINAVENNYMGPHERIKLEQLREQKAKLQQQRANTGDANDRAVLDSQIAELQNQINALDAEDKRSDQDLINACSGPNKNSSDCNRETNRFYDVTNAWNNGYNYNSLAHTGLSEQGKLNVLAENEVHIVNMSKYLRPNDAAVDSAMNQTGARFFAMSGYMTGSGISTGRYTPTSAGSRGSFQVRDPMTGRNAILENVTSRNMRVYEIPNGTWATANSDFDAMNLSNVQPIQSTYGVGGRMGTTENGLTVLVRPSQDGRPTIQVQRTQDNGKIRTVTEVRYGTK